MVFVKPGFAYKVKAKCQKEITWHVQDLEEKLHDSNSYAHNKIPHHPCQPSDKGY